MGSGRWEFQNCAPALQRYPDRGRGDDKHKDSLVTEAYLKDQGAS